MERVSNYIQNLSADSRSRYESKVMLAGLKIDPYLIDASDWSENPDTAPNVRWSDMMLYMTSTPSPYTKEEIKVCHNKNKLFFMYSIRI